jgi:uncharacterized membrane protein
MIDLIYLFKFVHVLAVAVAFGTWLCVALFMILAHRSATASVIALTMRFVVKAESMLMAPAIAVLPISGIPLAVAIGLSPGDQFWIMLSFALYVVFVAAWLGCIAVEMRISTLARDAVLRHAPLPEAYGRLFHIWMALAIPLVAGMIVVIALMIWQPRLS